MGGTHSGVATSQKYENGVPSKGIPARHPAYASFPSKVTHQHNTTVAKK